MLWPVGIALVLLELEMVWITLPMFSRDKLEAVAMGINNFTWTDTWLAERTGATGTPYFTGELYAKVHQICPGDACPWDICDECGQGERGKLKESIVGMGSWETILWPLETSDDTTTGTSTSVSSTLAQKAAE